MKMSELKHKLKDGDKVLGTMITIFTNPDLIKMLQTCGYDFCIIDCEHGYFTFSEVEHMICVARAIELPVMVRIAEIRRELVLKFMEMGANGLLLPNTETKEQAELLVKYSKYAPLGERGVSLSRPHTDFKPVKGREYMDQANNDTMLLCQIESQKGVKNVKEIINVPGIDVAFVGPNDMSQDFGILGQYDNPLLVDAFNKILAAAQQAGKVAGIHFGKKEPLVKWINQGYLLNMCGSDVSSLMQGAKANLSYIKENTEVK